MEAWVVPVIAGIFSLMGGIGGVLLTQFLQARNQRQNSVRDAILIRYAEFVGVASAEYQCAEQLDLAAPHVHNQATIDHLRDLDAPRHQHYRDLLRLSWQLQILESNPELCRLLHRLVTEMPFEIQVFCPDAGPGVHSEACTRYRQSRFAYGELITRLVNLVQETHLRSRPLQPATLAAAQPASAASPAIKPVN
jgi:hypothetical protein